MFGSILSVDRMNRFLLALLYFGDAVPLTTSLPHSAKQNSGAFRKGQTMMTRCLPAAVSTSNMPLSLYYSFSDIVL